VSSLQPVTITSHMRIPNLTGRLDPANPAIHVAIRIAVSGLAYALPLTSLSPPLAHALSHLNLPPLLLTLQGQWRCLLATRRRSMAWQALHPTAIGSTLRLYLSIMLPPPILAGRRAGL
jgi:hypothetical protein